MSQTPDTSSENELKINEEERRRKFENIFEEGELDIFSLKGLRFIRFNSKYIKFVFTPSEIVDNVGRNTKFIVTVYYWEKYKAWNITGRNILPQTYRDKIYALFGLKYFDVDDSNICEIIHNIYNYLVDWSKKYHKFCYDKYKRYLAEGDYLLLDEDDYQIFLSEEEREEIQEKRRRIQNRMISPERRRRNSPNV